MDIFGKRFTTYICNLEVVTMNSGTPYTWLLSIYMASAGIPPKGAQATDGGRTDYAKSPIFLIYCQINKN